MTIERRHVGKRLSGSSHSDGTACVRGQVAEDHPPTSRADTADIDRTSTRLLAEAGLRQDQVLSATITCPISRTSRR